MEASCDAFLGDDAVVGECLPDDAVQMVLWANSLDADHSIPSGDLESILVVVLDLVSVVAQACQVTFTLEV